jgi:single-stranded-DNA-specific exonuclease
LKSWRDPDPIHVPEALAAAVGGHPLVAARLARRGIVAPEAARRFLSAAEYVPAPPEALPDMDRAAQRVREAIQRGERILVWGDFDVDGQTATALLVEALRDLGAHAAFHIPNRFTEGHGIALDMLARKLDGVGLLLTCDTGISAHEAVAFAQRRGVDVVITDHHALPEALPEAFAIVNPMRLPHGHPLRELPGVGTAYQLIRALYGSTPSDHLLDLVAVGIVADVMVLVDDTRYWLQRGLEVLRRHPRPGLAAIMERADIAPADLTETDIGFALAPRLNALGRLADAAPAVELLTTSDQAVIAERVNELEGLNQKRRFLTTQVYEAARRQIEDDESLLKYAALVVVGAGWHTGVVGIVASRLAEDYGCPVVVLSEHDGVASGSARSVAGCSIIEAIRAQAPLLSRFGGHDMAAGLSLPADNVFAFRRGLSAAVRAQIGAEQIAPKLDIDGWVGLDEIDLAFAEDIGRLAPFGSGNPPLTLVTRDLHIASRRALGSRGDHLELRVEDDAGTARRVIWWFGDADALPEGKFDLAYTVRPHVFRGERGALIEWLDARPSASAPAVIGAAPRRRVIDLRADPNPTAALERLRASEADLLIWREGVSGIPGVHRHQLRAAAALAVWTIPPDPLIWTAALKTVQPETLYLFAQPSACDSAQALVSQLAGLIKYALAHKDGLIAISELAALTNQRDATIRAALLWLERRAALTFEALSDDVLRARSASAARPSDAAQIEARLMRLLAETAAYRRFWLETVHRST